jgi:glycosyltransferase involved in cell wall biosynthesis
MFPPRGGGTLRLFHVLEELSRNFEVHAVTFQPVEAVTSGEDGYYFPQNVRFYSPGTTPPPMHWLYRLPGSVGQAIHSRWLRRQWTEPASDVVLQLHHLVEKVLKENQIDAVIFTVLESLMLAPLVARLAPRAVRVVNTENVRYQLAEEELEHASSTDSVRRAALLREVQRIRKKEEQMGAMVDAVWAVSDYDARALSSISTSDVEFDVVPNGVDTQRRPFDSRDSKHDCRNVLFCGSMDYSPNPEGLNWFHSAAWPSVIRQHPEARLVVVGRGIVPSYLSAMKADRSVDLVGEVESVVSYYEASGVCVVPVKSGHGTRLKVLEAMSMGNPIVATQLGVEGIEITPGVDAIVENEISEFGEAVSALMSNAERFESVRRAARHLVETRYDWRVIGREMNTSLMKLIESKRAQSVAG